MIKKVLARFLALQKKDTIQMCSESDNSGLLIKDVFTNERCKAHGFHIANNTRVHSFVYDWEHDGRHRRSSVPTLGNLAKITEQELSRMPNMGAKSIALIKAVLREHQLELAQAS